MKSILTFFKGLAMGTCDVIPGVSGGTIAFITGIYDELLEALSSFNANTLKDLFTGRRRSFRKKIHGSFLLSVFAGIIVAILTLVKVITFLLATYPSFVWAFFFGLILASAFILRKSIKQRKHKYWIFAIIGISVGYLLTALPIVNMGTGSGSVFFSGFFAIIAMILPGISGSYILLILSQYQKILGIVVDVVDAFKEFISNGFAWEALQSAPIGKLGLFALGAILGLILFSRVLNYIKNHRHDQMVIVLTGFMIGSLNKVWPRKETVETFVDRHGEIHPLVEKNILPATTEQLLWGILFFAVGLGIVFGIMRLANKSASRTRNKTNSA